MQLFYSPTSPFVRKSIIVAKILGCYERILLLDSAAHPIQRDQNILKNNPLAQVPTLITNEGEALFDSKVICEYLNDLYHGTLFGNDENKWNILKEHCVADGIMSTTVQLRIETQIRPTALVWEDLANGYLDKIKTSLHYFEQHDEALLRHLNIAQITLACALAYLDFRFPDVDWRKSSPKLTKWFTQFSQHSFMKETEFSIKQ